MKPIFLFVKKKIFLFSIFLIGKGCFAQHNIVLLVKDTALKANHPIFVAGNFNNWKEHDTSYKMQQQADGVYKIELKNITKPVSFKFMRGGWSEVETTAAGEDVQNHELAVTADSTVYFTIANWKNRSLRARSHSASASVHIADTAFYIPQLQRYRKIWIYLPKVYYENKKQKFAVLYMHDGQNLFDNYTAAFNEWGVDECLDTLQKQTNKYAIVVGIENDNKKRLNEYNPYNNEKFGDGEGEDYTAFLVETLKPFIDRYYRTLPQKKYTAIAGSSMGALISSYAMLKYPDVFFAAGIFSPAYWVSPQIFADAQKHLRAKNKQAYYFYCGGRESEEMEPDMQKMTAITKTGMHNVVAQTFSASAAHNEAAWRTAFAGFYRWWVKHW